MNTFEQLVGRQITKILRLDAGEDFPPLSYPLAFYVMFDEGSGLLIGFNFQSETTTLDYLTLEELHEEYGTLWGEACLNELEPSDPLNHLVGQTLRSIKVGQFERDKLVGNSFVVKDEEYAGVLLQTSTEKLAIFVTKDGGQVVFGSDELPPGKQNWTFR